MSQRGAEGILKARMEETRRQKEAEAATQAEPDTYVIENPDSPSRTSRAFGRVNEFQRGADVNTGLRDPRLATWLYLAVVATSVMFSAKWGQIMQAVVSGTRK